MKYEKVEICCFSGETVSNHKWKHRFAFGSYLLVYLSCKLRAKISLYFFFLIPTLSRVKGVSI